MRRGDAVVIERALLGVEGVAAVEGPELVVGDWLAFGGRRRGFGRKGRGVSRFQGRHRSEPWFQRDWERSREPWSATRDVMER